MKNLIIKYFNEELTTDEKIKLKNWLKDSKNRMLFDRIAKDNFDLNLIYSKVNSEKSFLEINRVISKKDKLITFIPRSLLKYAVAAAIVLLISLPLVFNNSSSVNNSSIIVEDNIQIGSAKATLTLEDGSLVALEKGQEYTTNNLSSNGEELIYNNKSPKSEIAYNYLTIPRGGQYFVKLSDGTQVWLNSESQLKYPVNFIEGETREVELVYGEAYFDVSPSTDHNGDKFRVKKSEQYIEVLGTQFNLKAYKEDKIYATTLVEGKVRVESDFSNKILIPGEQSRFNIHNKEINIQEVDVSYEIAWKNGMFNFKNESLFDILSTLSRWYDVKVEFKNTSKKAMIFSGQLSRYDEISKMLSKIEKTGDVEFEINNRTIIVK